MPTALSAKLLGLTAREVVNYFVIALGPERDLTEPFLPYRPGRERKGVDVLGGNVLERFTRGYLDALR